MFLGMAKKTETIVTIIDDLDGTTVEEGKGETVKFALDNTSFEIDLGEKNAKDFRKLLAPYVQAGRVAGRSTSARSSAPKANKAELAALRTWARANGFEVSDRGRVSQEIRDAYAAAGN